MERAVDKLSFKGSIADAINEAKAQEKVFAVYISSRNESWLKWEQELFGDPSAVEFISRYCVFLHLMPDSLGASQFSAIYPQKSIPSISLVGYTGVLLWHEVGVTHEGYLDVRELVNNTYRAWTSLHLEETNAAALHGLECHSPSSHSVAPPEKGSSSGSYEPLDSEVKTTEHFEQLAEPKKSVDHGVCEMEDENDAKQGKVKCIQGNMKQDKEEQSNTTSDTGKQVLESRRRDPTEETHGKTLETTEGMAERKKLVDHRVCGMEDELNDTKQGKEKCTQWDIKQDMEEQSTTPTDTDNHLLESFSSAMNDPVVIDDADLSLESQKDTPCNESHANTSGTAQGMSTRSLESSQSPANQVLETTDAKRGADQVETSNTMISNVIHFKIRMPNGTMLQVSYTLSDTLESVKKYIDEHHTSGTGSYDLAIAYPRKVFSEKEMAMPLSEMDFGTRQSLIVVPHNRATGRLRGLSLAGTSESDCNNSGGYFQNVRRILSYMNPLSYLGGSATSSSSEVAAPNSRQDEWNPAAENQLSGQNPSGSDSRPYGSNVHTLRENEDEGPPGDRNLFWNGNSTQYGGSDDK